MSANYIVSFKEHVTNAQIEKYISDLEKNGGSVGHRYDSALKGFSATIPQSYLQTLQTQGVQGGDIDFIEADSIVTTQ